MEYDLKWESYHSWTSECIRNLSSDKRFADVTLLTEDLQAFKAHKVILSASSEFFKDVLETMNASLENYLFLKGVNGQVLNPLLKFIYEGEVSVDQDNLSKFLDAGFHMKITGIMSGNESVMRKRPEIQTLEESPPILEPEVEIKEEFTVKKSKRQRRTKTKAELKAGPSDVEIKEQFTVERSKSETEATQESEPLESEIDDEEIVSKSKELDDEISLLETQMNISDAEESDREAEDGEEENESIIIKQEATLEILKCEQESCEKKFTSKSTYDKHMKRTHSINSKVKDQPCPDCPKMFYTRHEVSAHHKRKHGNMEKKYPCPNCDKMFYQTGDVKQHVKSVHLKIRDLACGHCDMMFSAKSNLKSHMKKMHPSESD